MSSRLTASKLPRSLRVSSTCSWVVYLGYMQTGTTSTSPNNLKSRDFPSMTGRPALGPISPYPRTAVPSVTMAANLLVFE